MEQTTCYKCKNPMAAPAGSVDPLCASCETWFAEELARLDRIIARIN